MYGLMSDAADMGVEVSHSSWRLSHLRGENRLNTGDILHHFFLSIILCLIRRNMLKKLKPHFIVRIIHKVTNPLPFKDGDYFGGKQTLITTLYIINIYPPKIVIL